jgi:hypothetical protein
VAGRSLARPAPLGLKAAFTVGPAVAAGSPPSR